MGRVDKAHWLAANVIAHRGLHDEQSAENTLSAYEKAAAKGYPIEIDIHVTRDHQIVVFHDHTLTRATDGKDTRTIEECTYDEIKDVVLFGTAEKIPLLTTLLKLIDGRVPLLIEFKKKQGAGYELETEADAILSEYRGEYAIQSFNPFVLRWYRENNPTVLRGQLSSFFTNDKSTSAAVRFALKRMLFNRRNKPDFISYDRSNLPNRYVTKYVKKHNVCVLAWTVRSAEEYITVKQHCDNIIFENFIPESV